MLRFSNNFYANISFVCIHFSLDCYQKNLNTLYKQFIGYIMFISMDFFFFSLLLSFQITQFDCSILNIPTQYILFIDDFIDVMMYEISHDTHWSNRNYHIICNKCNQFDDDEHMIVQRFTGNWNAYKNINKWNQMKLDMLQLHPM